MPRSKDVLPPHSLAAEEAILGACMLDVAAVNACLVAGLDEPDFYGSFNRDVYGAIMRLTEEGLTPTVISVCHELRKTDNSPDLEGDVVEIAGRVFTAIGVEAHIKIVKDTSMQRQTIACASNIAKMAYDESNPMATIADGIGQLSKLAKKAGGGFERMGLNPLLSFDSGVMTGVPVIDKYLRGLQPGKLTVIAGHSGQGKSILGGQIVRQVARNGVPVGIFSMEMNASEYETRMAHALAGIGQRYDGNYTEADRLSISEAHTELRDYPIHFLYRPRLSLGELEAHCRLLSAEGVRVVLIDYLQLMQFATNERQDIEIGNATSTFKALSGDLDMHFIAISQMNRGAASELRAKEATKVECIVTYEKVPKPFIESLKGSSSIEQDADHILIIQRHPCQGNHVELFLLKNRGGQEGRCMMLEQFDRARFHRLTENEIYTYAHGDTFVARTLREDQGL